MSIDWGKYKEANKRGLADFHCHTTFCDGLDTAEDMVRAAVAKGMKAIGFSGHCHTFYDESYCMVAGQVDAYRDEINRLKNVYGDRIDVLCGIEQDCLAGRAADCWDYVIGSVHYVKCGDEYVPVDETPEIILEAADKYFDGDIYSFVDRYYETVAGVAEATGADIIGHFDIICKHNAIGKEGLFDERNPRYIASWKKAADKAVKAGIPFEINTAPLSRNFRTEPYPIYDIRKHIEAAGGTFVMSSDSHSIGTLGYWAELEKGII